jgi:ClpP class serine protease
MGKTKKTITVSQSEEETKNEPNNSVQTTAKTSEVKSEILIKDIVEVIQQSFSETPPPHAESKRDELIKDYLKQQMKKFPISENYNIMILFDEGTMVKKDADRIYSAATNFSDKKPMLFILYSSGGIIGSAYLIGKLCREYSNNRLIVVVPRYAKSAATLICCAADEIHMGSLSELGPIDPQINDLPALGLKSAVEHIADLIQKYPNSAEMFARYLNYSLKPVNLGYYERVAESATQYAEKLLKTHSKNLNSSPSKIAKDLVYSYKDHGFVIDKTEALEIFGSKIIKHNTPEYELGNALYEQLSFISKVADIFDQYFYLIGSCDSDLVFRKKR